MLYIEAPQLSQSLKLNYAEVLLLLKINKTNTDFKRIEFKCYLRPVPHKQGLKNTFDIED